MSQLIRNAIASSQTASEFINLTGGLDQETPPMQRKPGSIRLGQNFEALINGGYARIAGYERLDGRPKPSDATYTLLPATITGAPAVGNTLTGLTSAASGKIIAIAGSQFALTKVTGTFQSGESLQVSSVTIATATDAPTIGGAATPLLRAQYSNLAADVYRADITAVPGEGAILGVVVFDDVVYAFRNAVGGATAAMYKSTSSGWDLVDFEYEVSFTVGNGAAVAEGGVLTQGGVTSTIRRVLVRDGSLSDGTAEGAMIISVTTGGNFAAGAATVGAGTLTLSGAQTAITLLPSGRYEFAKENFGVAKRLYGCDGVNRAFEFDGDYFVPIATGMPTDAPGHIYAHKSHLFLSFGWSVQHSGTSDPYAWTPITGAAEISMGDDVTGFTSMPGTSAGGALAIFTRNRLSVLYGSSSADWQLTPYRDELGAYPYTIQDVGTTLFLDDRGVTDLQTSQSYGNFSHASVTNKIKTLMNEYRLISTDSCISRDKNQYRIFFSNNYSLFITMAGSKIIGVMPMLFPDVVLCAHSAETNNGSEIIVFGSDNGFVYQMEKGTSFDGQVIEAFFYLPYNFQGNVRAQKRYRDLMFEIDGTSYVQFSVGHELGYGSTDTEQPVSVTANLTSSTWDRFVWDVDFWDGQTLVPITLPLEGEAENISVIFSVGSDYISPFTITSMIIGYTTRRRLRS